jgi:hypothetical protein
MVIFHSKLVVYQRDSHRRIEKANLRFGEWTSSANLFWNEGDFHRMSLCWVYTLQSSKKKLVHQFGPLKQSLPASNNGPGIRDSPHRAPTGATIGFAAIAAQMLLPYIVAAPHPQKCPMSQNRDVRERRDKKFSAGAVPNPSNHKPILKFMVNFSDRVDARIARKTVRACWAIVVWKNMSFPFHGDIQILYSWIWIQNWTHPTTDLPRTQWMFVPPTMHCSNASIDSDLECVHLHYVSLP